MSPGVRAERVLAALRQLALASPCWLVISASACAYSAKAALGPSGPPVDPGSVLGLARTDPGRPHEVVGLVTAQVDGEDTERLLEKLRLRAAELGADAVVDVRIRFDMGVWSAGLDASGTAVRFR